MNSGYTPLWRKMWADSLTRIAPGAWCVTDIDQPLKRAMARMLSPADRLGRPSHRLGAGADERIDPFNPPISHPEHMAIGKAAGKMNERYHQPLLFIDQEAPWTMIAND